MLWKCDECTTLYAVDMPRCPQCGATGHVEVDSGGEPVGPRFDQPEQADQLRQEPAAGPDQPPKPAARPAAGKAAG